MSSVLLTDNSNELEQMRQSPSITAVLGLFNPVKMLQCQGFTDLVFSRNSTLVGIPPEKGRERKILQREGMKVWSMSVLIQSFGGRAAVCKVESPHPVPSP